MAASRSWLCADGTRLQGESFGDAAAPLVILAHGGGQTRHAWRRAALMLGENGFHAVTYDLRGHGQSDPAASGDYSEAGLVQDIQAIAAAHPEQRPVLIGASAGGHAALAAMGLRQVDAAGLCLVDFAPATDRQGYERIRAFMLAGLQGFATADDAARALALYRGAPARPAGPGLSKVLRACVDGRYRWHWDPAFLAARHADLDHREARLAAYARGLSCPVLLLRGADSDFVTDAAAEAFLRLCPHAASAAIPGAGHMLGADSNDAFAAALLPFLRAL